MKVFFAGIIAAIASLFGGPYHAPAPADSMLAASAAAITTHTVTPGFAASEPVSGTTTIVNSYVTSPIVERVETRALDTSVLDAKIQALRNDMFLRIAQIASPSISFSGPAPSTPVSVASFAASQRIDSLTNVTLTNATVSGVAGLTDADISDSITASNYLPLTGGSLTFASSTLFSVFNNAYFGATATSSFDSAGALTLATPLLVSSGGTGASAFGQGWIYSDGGSTVLAASTSPTVNYITATSTTATSTFAGGIIGPNNFTVQSSSGNVGIGTTNPGGATDAPFTIRMNSATHNNNTIAYLAAFDRVNSDTASWYMGADTSANAIMAANNRDLYMGYDLNGTFTPVLTMAGQAFGGTGNNGNIGIGDTSPTYKLDVTGAGHFTSYVDAANFIATSSATASIFNGGFLSLASSTIGSGTQAGGLTISGGATTTGQSYFVSANPAVKERRTTTATGYLSTVTQVDRQTTATAVDGFGPGISFSLSDNTISDSFLARVAAERKGSNNSGQLSFSTYKNGLSNENFVITPEGNIGISQSYLGTYVSTEPTARLTVVATSSNSTVPLFALQTPTTSGLATTSVFLVDANGNVGVGTTTPYSRLTVWGPDTAAGTAAFLIANSASTTEFAVYDDGSATLAGTLTQNSDMRLKTNVESLNASSTLDLIAQLDPVIFHWADPAKSSTPQLGFIAQDVQKVFPQLVSTTSPTAQTPDGTLGLNYIGFIAPIVEAIKALMAELHDLSITVASFAQSFTSAIGNFGQVNTNKLCATDGPGDQNPVCVTKTQLAALLSQSAAAGFANPSPTSPATSLANPTPAPSQPQDTEPPVITINGNNPATINVGDTYNDLGASITDNVDHNLGIHTFVGTTPIDQAVIDTSEPATYHIYYVATDGTGNTATSTRSVIIESVDASPPPIYDASSTPPALAQ